MAKQTPGKSPRPAGLKSTNPGKKPKAKVVPYDKVAFKPRATYGEMCSIGQICGEAQSTELGFGFARMTNARIPWTIRYDEVLFVVSGVLKVHCNGGTLVGRPHDSIWLPAGTELVYEAEDCLMAYAIHPVDWASRGA